MKILGLVIIDFIIIWFGVKKINPDSSTTIALTFLIPLVIVINLVIAVIFHYTKSTYANLFVINSIISAFLMYFIFMNRAHLNQKLWTEENLYEWRFKINEELYEIQCWKKENTFTIYKRTSPNSLIGVVEGTVEISNKGEFYLISDTVKYKIKDDYLLGFEGKDSIKLKSN